MRVKDGGEKYVDSSRLLAEIRASIEDPRWRAGFDQLSALMAMVPPMSQVLILPPLVDDEAQMDERGDV
jgi:hypothetical protein